MMPLHSATQSAACKPVPLVILMLLTCLNAAAGYAQGNYGEKIEFVSELRGKQETVFGYLSLPPGAASPVPATVLVHGSGGLGEREARYMAEFIKLGIATFALDSFSPRGVGSTVDDQSRVSTAAMVSDAFGALKLLSVHPKIDKSRIGILGGSKGGSVALETAVKQAALARKVPDGVAFAAHIPMYPGCTVQYRKPVTSGAPILMLLGGRDDWTGGERCPEYAQAFKNGGAEIRVIVYPNAEHAFDGRDGQTHFAVGFAQNFSKCLAYVEEDGKLVYAKSGAVLDSPKALYDVMSKDCMTRGASIGTDSTAKAKSLEDIRDFLKQTLLKQ
jgi:dienelactone hydrolase